MQRYPLKTKEVSPIVILTDRPNVPYRRRVVSCRYGMCQTGARYNFCPCFRRLQSVFLEQELEQKRRARAGYNHGDPTCMCYHCDRLSEPDPSDTLAIDLNDGDDISCGCSGEMISVPAVVDHACMPTLVCVIVAKLSKFRVQSAARINGRMRTTLEGVLFSWQFRQSLRYSLRASARVEGERRPRSKGEGLYLERGTNDKNVCIITSSNGQQIDVWSIQGSGESSMGMTVG